MLLLMKVSYINHVRDVEEEACPIPLEQLQHSLQMAIEYQNIDLIEPLLSKGVPLTQALPNGQSPLIAACAVGDVAIIEKLLITSVRTFNLFPPEDVLRVMEWLFQKRLYGIVDLTFFSIKQSPENMKKYGRFIETVEALEKLADKDEADNHDKLRKTLIKRLNKEVFRKEFYYYLYSVWKKHEKDIAEPLEIYQILSQAFEREQERFRAAQLLRYRAKFLWNSTAILAVTSIVSLKMLLFLPSKNVALGLSGALAVGAISMIGYLLKEKKRHCARLALAQQHQTFLKDAREGNYAQVSQYLESGGYINVIQGVAESTPLREATRLGHKDIKVLLSKFGAYSAEGSEAYTFPQ